MAKQVCFCFGYTDEDIREDVSNNNGQSTILKHIAAEKKAGNCLCAIKNPKGT